MIGIPNFAAFTFFEEPEDVSLVTKYDKSFVTEDLQEPPAFFTKASASARFNVTNSPVKQKDFPVRTPVSFSIILPDTAHCTRRYV